MWHEWERRGRRDHLEDQGIVGRMVSKWILGRLAGECRVDPILNRDRWQALVNTVMNLWVLAHGVGMKLGRVKEAGGINRRLTAELDIYTLTCKNLSF
jgi:hypothetical protein